MDASLPQLSRYIEDNMRQIDGVRKEIEEIQVGFNSKYVEWKANHDATLERLVEAVISRLDDVGPDLRGRIDERVAEEKRIIADRRKELRDTLIPRAQAEADGALKEGQSITEMMREENPRLNEKEEKLKARREKLEGNLADLNTRIRKLSGCLGVAINFFKITKLDRERQQVIGQLQQVHEDLKEVREEWQQVRQGMQTEQETLEVHWQELTREVAQMQGELDYLDEESNREGLALKRAVRTVIDDLKETIPCPVADVKSGLDAMVTLNVQTDDYQEGLGAVSSLMSLLMGIGEGMKRLNASVEGLIQEQRMHSTYLAPLNVYVPDDVTAFHGQWTELVQKVRDDGRLCENPAEFLAAVRPVMEEGLSEKRIKEMFERLAEALSAAASNWR
jgi:predicted  nucleic acid-binding Zn-ribbon protein